MNDNITIEKQIKDFLHFATRERGGSIIFGTQFDATEQKWMGAMSIGTTKITFPPGLGRRVSRELREVANSSGRDLTQQMRADLGAEEFEAIFDQIDGACKLAMVRNAENAKPEVVGAVNFNA